MKAAQLLRESSPPRSGLSPSSQTPCRSYLTSPRIGLQATKTKSINTEQREGVNTPISLIHIFAMVIFPPPHYQLVLAMVAESSGKVSALISCVTGPVTAAVSHAVTLHL